MKSWFSANYMRLLVWFHLGAAISRAGTLGVEIYNHKPWLDDFDFSLAYLGAAAAWQLCHSYKRLWRMADDLVEKQEQLLNHMLMAEIKRITVESAAAGPTLQ